MYEIFVDADFCAVHRVPLPSGELEPLHGHDWKVTATFSGAHLDASGMLVDFILAQDRLRSIAAQLHHADLNTSPLLRGIMPTAENIARVIYDLLYKEPALGPLLSRVTVTEAPGCRASYGRAAKS